MRFPHLAAGLSRGRLRLKNRIVFPGHQTLMSSGGIVGDQMYRYYLERAKGGTGAVVVEGAAIHPTAPKFPSYLLAYEEAIVPSLDRLADGLHQYDCAVWVQLAHSGSRMPSLDSMRPLWAPSDVRSAISPEIPHAMTEDEIGELLDGYEHAAAVVARSRVDGVEFHSAHEYLPGQFLSPVNNRRIDGWGGSLDNRMRFLLEGLRRTRAGLGEDKVLGLRINGDDLREDGLGTEDYVEVVTRVENTGLIDYVSVSAGTSAHNHMVVPPMDVEHGVFVPFAAAIRKAVSVPVIAVGRIKDPVYADDLIAGGDADAVAVTRAQIADPEWARKVQDPAESPRPCIGCNQGCFGNLYLGRHLTCSVNPAVGREKELGLGTVPPLGEAKRVAVVGGGPAGMEAALTAAQRGHDVVVFEAEPTLGGQAPLASLIEARRELGEIVTFQAEELKQMSVEIRLGMRATTEALAEFEAIILATGSVPRESSIPSDGGCVVTPHEALEARDENWSGQSVVVLDDVGHFPAYLPAEVLADAGAQVIVATTKLSAGSGLDSATLMTMHTRLARKNVEFLVHSAATHITGTSVHFRDTLSGREFERSADTIVAACGNKAADELRRTLNDRYVIPVGDCTAPRTITEAVREGRLAGLGL